jgi:ferric-dicitrate binding protein FerR (iron transport regulator)
MGRLAATGRYGSTEAPEILVALLYALRYRQRLPRKAALRIVETIALVAAALAVAWWLAPEDPFGLQAQSPGCG